MQPPLQTWVKPGVLDCAETAKVIRLVPLEVAHAPEMFSIADPQLFTHSTQGPAEWSVQGFEEEMRKVSSLPGVVAYAIVLARAYRGLPAGRVVGRTTYMDIKPEHRGLEIGRTWIGRPLHGSRVNPEAKYLMLLHAFEVLTPSAIRVQITTSGTNAHSQHAIAKLGAKREGVLRKARIMGASCWRAESVVQDWVIFSVVEEEWPGVKTSLEARLREMPLV